MGLNSLLLEPYFFNLTEQDNSRSIMMSLFSEKVVHVAHMFELILYFVAEIIFKGLIT